MKDVVVRYLPASVQPFAARIASSAIASRLVNGTFWSLVGTVLARGLSVLASIATARKLGTTGFGEFGIVQSTVLSVSVVIAYGFGMTATKHIAEFRFSDPVRAGRIMLLSDLFAFGAGALLAAILALASPWLASRTLAAPHLAGLLRIGALYLFFSTLNGAHIGSLAGFQAFRTIAFVNLLSGVATFLCIVSGVWLAGLTGAVWGLVVSTAIGWLVAHVAMRREAARAGVPLTLRDIHRDIPVVFKFSLPAILASTLYGPINWVCNAILVNEPDGFAQMGIFNATTQWFALIMFIPGLLGQVVLPMLSESVGAGDEARSRRILRLTILINSVVVTPLVMAIALMSPWLMSLYGESFSQAWPVLVISLATAGVLAVQSPVGQSLNAEGRLWTVFFLNLGWSLTFIAMTVLLRDRGAHGLVIARMVAYLFLGAGQFILAYGYKLTGPRNRSVADTVRS